MSGWGANGVDVFRIFDAMNDIRNLQTAVKAAIKQGAHAQGTMSYTVSPVHSLQTWLDMANELQDMGVHSICIKDMAGLLQPYVAFDLVKKLKKAIDELNLKEHIIFIGHELNINSKYLLENDKMDYVIGHDVELEVTVAFDKINSYFNNTLDKDFYYSDVLIYNKYNCLNKRVF